MNEITRRLVIETAKKHKPAAKRNDREFMEMVLNAYWMHMMSEYGVELKMRALDLFRQFRPEFYDRHGYLNEFQETAFDIDLALSGIITGILDRKITRDPELRLHYDWGDLPKLTVDPQLSLFDHNPIPAQNLVP